jgi:tRNA-Thr(GGU) m(6)t(6)A37 methyltransferase TsaA
MGALRRLAERLTGATPTVPPMEPVTLQPVGIVRSPLRDLRYRDTSDKRAVIQLTDAFVPALSGLDGFSHAIVLTWLDRVSDTERETLQEHPGGIDSLPLTGVFALRTHHRPNPIGITVVRVDRLEGACLHVVGLDAVDGTPVLDIKPYLPPYDSVPDARLPSWATGSGD